MVAEVGHVSRSEVILDRLKKVHPRGNGKYHALCPAHPDRTPSLSIRVAGTKILVRCWAGCETLEIVAAMGLTMADLFIRQPRHVRTSTHSIASATGSR